MAFAVAGLAFAALLVLQGVVWRLRAVRGHYLALSGLAAFVLVWMTGVFAALRLGSPFDWANAALLYVALTLAYMVTYSAMQGDSPTFAILRAVGAAGERGCLLGDLYARFDDQRLIVARLDDLVNGGLAVCSAWVTHDRTTSTFVLGAATYRLTSRGRVLTRLFLAYRRLLGMEKGG